jgi:hypothetical protein
MALKQHLAVMAAATVFGVNAAPNDQEVLTTVLNHFAERDDASIGKEGPILLRPLTQLWTEERIRGFGGLRDGSDICSIPNEMYAQFAKRNATEATASALVASSSRWRFATEGELKPGAFGFSYKTSSGSPARTLAGVVRPAYSDNGDTAFVMFRYAWSMHLAIAQYIAQKTANGWSVKCSQLRFYP